MPLPRVALAAYDAAFVLLRDEQTGARVASRY
jgi:hypothetical protein